MGEPPIAIDCTMLHDAAMETSTDTQQETPSDPTTPATRLTRPTDGRMIAGVAAAFADRTGIDVGIIRLGFVLSAFFGGFGLVAYAAAWALLPNEGETHSPAERWFGKG